MRGTVLMMNLETSTLLLGVLLAIVTISLLIAFVRLKKRVGAQVSQMTQTVERFAARITEMESDKIKHAAILNHMTEGVLAVGEKRQVLLMNPSAARILDVSEKQAVGSSLLETVAARLCRAIPR